MTTLIIITAGLYFAIGALVWKTIVLRKFSQTDASKCRTDDEYIVLYVNQHSLRDKENSGDPAQLICKAVFLCAWPFFLMYGFFSARFLDAADLRAPETSQP